MKNDELDWILDREVTDLNPPPSPSVAVRRDKALAARCSNAPVDAIVSKGRNAMFKRRGIRMPLGEGVTEHVGMLVLELDGVRCYVGNHRGRLSIVLTKENIEP